VLLVLLVPGREGQATSFADRLGGTPRTKVIADALSRAIVRSVPLAAASAGASAGVSRSWDDALGTITIDKYLFGQIYLERPETIGRGNWSVGTSYQWVHPASLDGRHLDQLSDVRPPICGARSPCQGAFTVPAYHLDLVTNQVTMAATYGVTDALEVNLILPTLVSGLDTRVLFFDLDTGKAIRRVNAHDDAAGVGDLVLRGKYSLLSQGPLTLAMGLGLSLPTGNADNFQGIGSVLVSPALYGSTDRLGEHLGFVLRPYVNVGADLDAENVAASEVRWGLGMDFRRGSRFTAGVGFLARHVLEAFGPSGALDLVRCAGTPDRCRKSDPPPPEVTAPFLGIEAGRRDLYDLTLTVRAAFFQRRLIATLSCTLPLNDQGVRPAPTPLVGIEVPFMRVPPGVL
jgi:hypothetical protein